MIKLTLTGVKMFKNIKVMYVEDEDLIRNKVLDIFEIMSIEVIAFDNAKEAYINYQQIKPDILITDIEMKDMNGLELVKKIRDFDKKTPILITTAYTNTEYLLNAVELNLTKYLLKPIALIELTDALKMCMSIIGNKETDFKKYFNTNDYFDTKESKLILDNKIIDLDYKENVLLQLLIKNANQVVTYEQIETNVWNDEYMSMGALRTIIKRLRYKLPDNIKNISKIGYKVIIKEC